MNERKKLADGIYQGDLLLLELTDGNYARGFVLDLLLTSEGKPAALKLDHGMVELEKVKSVKVGQVNYVPLEEIVAEEAPVEEPEVPAES